MIIFGQGGIVPSVFSKQDYSGYPTKKEYEKNIRKINENELNSDRFKITKEFIFLLNQRENLDLEERLFKIIGTYGLEENLLNKSYEYIKESKEKRFNELKMFMNSLTLEQINSNPYLKATAEFMETSIVDCKIIIENLQQQIKNVEITDKNMGFEVNINIPKESLELLPLPISEQTSIRYYNPKVYKNEWVYVLDENNRFVYEEYNKYVRNISKIAEDVYHLEMWELLSQYPEQINNYYFYILNNEFEHEFRTSYFVKKYKESFIEDKKELHSLGEETNKEIFELISRTVGIFLDTIVDMDFNKLEIKSPMDEEHIFTIEKVDKEVDKIASEPKLILTKKKRVLETEK